jgi:hypothetical protein
LLFRCVFAKIVAFSANSIRRSLPASYVLPLLGIGGIGVTLLRDPASAQSRRRTSAAAHA